MKANAFVLGIDSQPIDRSLNARPGTHFQFEECDLSNDEHAPTSIIEAASRKFGRERVDVLVNVVSDEADLGGLKSLSSAAEGMMKEQGSGSIISVVDGEGVKSKPAVGSAFFYRSDAL